MTTRIARFALLAAALAVYPTLTSVAADKDKETKPLPRKPGTFITAEEAGPDFAVQGEYEGEIAGKGKLGAQVVALGDGKFDVYFLTGGLPGAGWDKKGRVKVAAKTEGGKTAISSKEFSGSITEGALSGKNEGGDAFTLKRVVRESPAAGAKPPEGATILFDGTSTDAFGGGKIAEEKLLFRGVNSKKPFGAGKYHFEFRTPFQPKARGQGRGNSGVYVIGIEVQVLDSFGLDGKKDECGAFYSMKTPDVNMCFPPLSWQTYDIEIKEGEKGESVATVIHNGVKVHDNVVIKKDKPKPQTINLQDHGDYVVYRNIWVLESK